MNDEISVNHNILPTRGDDAHGQAAMLLVESLIHLLIEKRVLTVAEAVETIDVASEVMSDRESEFDGLPATSQASIHLLQCLSASLSFDLDGQVPRGAPA